MLFLIGKNFFEIQKIEANDKSWKYLKKACMIREFIDNKVTFGVKISEEQYNAHAQDLADANKTDT